MDILDKRPTLWKMDTGFCTWNVRSQYRPVYFITVSRGIAKYKLPLVGVKKVRCGRVAGRKEE
jgi:hypothetical protein